MPSLRAAADSVAISMLHYFNFAIVTPVPPSFH